MRTIRALPLLALLAACATGGGPETVILEDGVYPAGLPETATAHRLEGLHARVRGHADARGALPDSVGEVAPADGPWAPLRTDAWDRPIVLRRAGDRYELRSAGADGALDTADDVWLVGRRGRYTPCAVHVPRRVFRFDDPSGASCGDA